MRFSPKACSSVPALVGAALAILLAFATPARADYAVTVCQQYPNEVFTPFTDGAVTIYNATCPNLSVEMNPNVAANVGDRAGFQANAPAGLEIVGATVPTGDLSAFLNGGLAWGGGFYWQ